MASDTTRPRPVGINHVALEVDDVERALAFYGRLFDIRRVDREPGGVFVDLGDQFIAMFEPGAQEDRHFGLVVDDKEAGAPRARRRGGRTTARAAGWTSATRSAIASSSCSTTRSSS